MSRAPIAPSIPVASHADRLATEHFSVLDALFDERTLAILRDEGERCRDAAVLRTIDVPRIGDTGRIGSQTCHRLAAPGPELQGLHESDEVRALAHALLGKVVFPTRASYLYYEVGDHVGLHQDAISCELTLLVALSAGREPITLHPELVDAAPERMLALAMATDGLPPGGVDVAYPEGGAIALIGGRLPHRRAPVNQPAMIAALCFKPLL